MLDPHTKRVVEAPAYAITDLLRDLAPLGYREEEVDGAIELLEARQVLCRDGPQRRVIALQPNVPGVDEVKDQLKTLQARCGLLHSQLAEPVLAPIERTVRQYQTLFGSQATKPTAQQLIGAQRAMERSASDLQRAVDDRRHRLLDEAARYDTSGPDIARFIDSLQHAATGGLFVDQLNRVRMELVNQATGVRRKTDEVREKARKANSCLADSTVNDQALAESGGALGEVKELLRGVLQQWESLQARLAAYREAQQLLTDASTLLNEKILTFGEAVSGQQQDLERWAMDIKGALSASRLDALSEIDTWRSRFQVIRTEVSDYEQRVREIFLNRQTALRELLTGRLRINASSLAPSLAFNPTDPDGSYRLITQHFREDIDKLGHQAQEKIEEARRSARDMRGQSVLSALSPEQREHAEDDMRGVEDEAARIQAELASCFRRLSVFAGESSSASISELDITVQAIIAVSAPLEPLASKVQSLRKLLQETKLSPDETVANEILSELASRGAIDFNDFAERLEVKDIHDPWMMIKGLSSKSRVRVRLQLLRQ